MPLLRAETDTYATAVTNGNYNLDVGGLFGKTDNVRRYWEDQITRMLVRPHVATLVASAEQKGRGIRILDLGSGTGQSYEILTQITRRDRSLYETEDYILPCKTIADFLGVDMSEDMVRQASEIYRDHDNVNFVRGDLREGLTFLDEDEPAFDLYYSTYGSLSHLAPDELRQLLTDILAHARPGAILVGDWLGAYGCEFQDRWNEHRHNPSRMLDYSMCWLYPPGQRDDVESFPMTFWSSKHLKELAEQVSAQTGANLRPLNFYDRSIFVGRHSDTHEYCRSILPTRSIVNRLHEENYRTELDMLLVDYSPLEGFDEANAFFDHLADCWNALVRFCDRRLRRAADIVETDGWQDFPPQLQTAIMTLDRVIHSADWMRMGDMRANIIEPQLGYALRGLEMGLQEGAGFGHGLLGIFVAEKE